MNGQRNDADMDADLAFVLANIQELADLIRERQEESRRRQESADDYESALNRGTELLRGHFGGDWPRGYKAGIAFLTDHYQPENVWGEVGVAALMQLFQSGPADPAEGTAR